MTGSGGAWVSIKDAKPMISGVVCIVAESTLFTVVGPTCCFDPDPGPASSSLFVVAESLSPSSAALKLCDSCSSCRCDVSAESSSPGVEVKDKCDQSFEPRDESDCVALSSAVGEGPFCRTLVVWGTSPLDFVAADGLALGARGPFVGSASGDRAGTLLVF